MKYSEVISVTTPTPHWNEFLVSKPRGQIEQARNISPSVDENIQLPGGSYKAITTRWRNCKSIFEFSGHIMILFQCSNWIFFCVFLFTKPLVSKCLDNFFHFMQIYLLITKIWQLEIPKLTLLNVSAKTTINRQSWNFN